MAQVAVYSEINTKHINKKTYKSNEASSNAVVHDPRQSNVFNRNNVRHEATRHFRNKNKAYLKAKIEDVETNSKIKNIRGLYRGISIVARWRKYFPQLLYVHGVNDIKKGYQHRTNVVKNEKGDLVADSYIFVASWRNYFSQLLNVHGVHDVRQTETHTAEPLVPEPSAFEVDLVIEKLKSHKSPGIVQIQAELIKEGGKKIRYQIHKLIVSIWNKQELSEEWKSRSLYLSIRRGIKQTVITIGAYHFCQLRTKYCPTSFSQG